MSSLYPPHQPYNAPSHKPTYSYKRSAIPSSPYIFAAVKKTTCSNGFVWVALARTSSSLSLDSTKAWCPRVWMVEAVSESVVLVLVVSRFGNWGCQIFQQRLLWRLNHLLEPSSSEGNQTYLFDWYSWDGHYNTCFLGEYDSANHVWETYINQLV